MPNIHGLGPAATSSAPIDGVKTLSASQATQGIKFGQMRYVLGIGLALAVGAGAILAIFLTH